MKIVNFINLTNGIEFLPEVESPHFIRIQSTTIERKNWTKLFSDLDHDFLINLALGHDCRVYDCGTNRPLSKTIYFAVPFIEYCLCRFWYGQVIKARRFSRGGQEINDVDQYYDTIYRTVFEFDSNKDKERVKEKLKYHKRFLRGDTIRLTGISKATIHDGDVNFYRTLLHEKY